MVDKEDADVQSPKEGSKGSAPSKRKSKRSVSTNLAVEWLQAKRYRTCSRAPDPMMTMLLWSTPIKLAKVQTLYRGQKISPLLMLPLGSDGQSGPAQPPGSKRQAD